MQYWQTPEFRALKKELGGRVAGVILANGCKTFVEFCEKFSTHEMMRLPNFSGASLEIVTIRAGEAGIVLREDRVIPLVRPAAKAAKIDDNDLFLHCSHAFPDTVCIAIGSRRNKRSVTVTADEALKLAYRLMSLAKGGETHGFEKLERTAPKKPWIKPEVRKLVPPADDFSPENEG